MAIRRLTAADDEGHTLDPAESDHTDGVCHAEMAWPPDYLDAHRQEQP